MSNSAKRISAMEAKQAVDRGALLVSAYDGEKFEKSKIGNAVSASEFAEMAPDMDKDSGLIFYCT